MLCTHDGVMVVHYVEIKDDTADTVTRFCGKCGRDLDNTDRIDQQNVFRQPICVCCGGPVTAAESKRIFKEMPSTGGQSRD